MGNYTRNWDNNKKIRPLQTETDRNDQIRKQFESGSYTKASLARMYHVTRQRIHQIVTALPQEEAESHE